MKIAIIGIGLIGGSISLALKASSMAQNLKIVGIPRRKETIRAAIKMGAIDEGTTNPEEGVKDADIIFICTPINLIIPILKEISPNLKEGAIVTDVGSSKGRIVFEAERLLSKGRYFIGGHPMAGKEKVKLEEAQADLFKGKTYVLARTSKSNKKALEKMKEVVSWMGGAAVVMEPKLHDLVVAAISHMPLAVAAALVYTIEFSEKGKEEMLKCAASGFRDSTRIASGDPILGADMFSTNKEAVLMMLSAFRRSLSRIENLIKEGDPAKIERELEIIKVFRDSIYG
jgi:prephenate dehydrogenase